jgi:transcriptional regulator with XRE-family HTH domain
VEMTVGTALRLARKNAGMTGDDVADHLELSTGAYRRYERDEVSPQASIILQLADIYGITTDTLLRGATDASDTPRQVVEMQVGQGQTVSITINAQVIDSAQRPQKVTG